MGAYETSHPRVKDPAPQRSTGTSSGADTHAAKALPTIDPSSLGMPDQAVAAPRIRQTPQVEVSLGAPLPGVVAEPPTRETKPSTKDEIEPNPRSELKAYIKEAFVNGGHPPMERLTWRQQQALLPFISTHSDTRLAKDLGVDPMVVLLEAQRILDSLKGVNENLSPEVLAEAKTRISTAVRGNIDWPQTYLSGILLAAKEAELATDERPLDVIAKTEPPQEAINRMMAARDTSHRDNGFDTKALPQERDATSNADALKSVWLGYKMSANGQLVKFGKLAYFAKYGVDVDTLDQKPSFSAMMREFQSDQLFRGLLTTAKDAFSTQTVAELSTQYKGLIGDFMKKYAPLIHTHMGKPELAPPQYREEQAALMDNLQRLLGDAAEQAKAALLAFVATTHPDKATLRDRMTGMKVDDLFGDVRVRRIDPLRITHLNN